MEGLLLVLHLILVLLQLFPYLLGYLVKAIYNIVKLLFLDFLEFSKCLTSLIFSSLNC